MRQASPRRLLTIIAVSLELVGAPEAFAREEEPEGEVQTMPESQSGKGGAEGTPRQ